MNGFEQAEDSQNALLQVTHQLRETIVQKAVLAKIEKMPDQPLIPIELPPMQRGEDLDNYFSRSMLYYIKGQRGPNFVFEDNMQPGDEQASKVSGAKRTWKNIIARVWDRIFRR